MNRLSEATKFILMSASILIVCGLAAYMFMIFNQSKEGMQVVNDQMNSYVRDLQQSDIVKYDGLEVQGSDVINFVKKNVGSYTGTETGPFIIKVITTLRSTDHKNKTWLPKITNFASEFYIKPTAKFVGTVTINGNGVITEVKFEQK